MRSFASPVIAVAILCGTASSTYASARSQYEEAMAREQALRAEDAPALKDVRAAIQAYERIVRRYPGSGYSDNALWRAAGLARLAWERFGQPRDRETAVALLERIRREYPSSSLVARVDAAVAALVPAPPAAPRVPAPAAAAFLVSIKRTLLRDGVRITMELDREVPYEGVRLDDPPRVYFDFAGVQPADAVRRDDPQDDPKGSYYNDDIVREIRIGRRPNATTRVVMPLDGVARYSAFALYDPYRIVVDFVREAGGQRPETGGQRPQAGGQLPMSVSLPSHATSTSGVLPKVAESPAVREATAAAVPPVAPAANGTGGFSIARQLGLGVSRVVIDPGHGGHDPGAQANRLSEAALVLDVALRLEKLLLKQRNLEVVLTRRTDAFIPLEERTARANREAADLFLSIHANASSNPKARGVETYFLNFASNAEAEAVAARENSASGRTMHSLPEIVRAIALNNKLDESRDLAGLVQRAMVRKLRPHARGLRDLGVKQAPFVVLIGAGMPSVLAEISFVTNRTEGALLRGGAYRQRIAEALADAILQYQRSLKKVASLYN